ncbi:MAG: heparinase II/III family protein [Paracoccaceae bacterium]
MTRLFRSGTELATRLAVWRAGLTSPAKGFVSQPEPRTIGLVARGRQLLAGNLQLAGHLVEAPGQSLWDIAPPDAAFAAEAHGFAWLDDLAAVGDAPARNLAQAWVWAWIARFGQGAGAGWAPDLTGRRLIRLINHAIFLLQSRDTTQSAAFYTSLTRQTVLLSYRWAKAPPGLPRFEALSGLVYAGLSLIGMDALVGPASAALARDCAHEIDAAGGIPSRNPEDLLEVFTLLIWAAEALTGAGRDVPAPHLAAIERIAPALRALRHGDGSLARFHGGGRGIAGRLDQSLAAAGGRAIAQAGPAMGFVRLAAGRSSVIADAAPPPPGPRAHASTLAFEMTSGRRPVIVNCGSGRSFGSEWQHAGRATPSHSTLCIDGVSSSRLGATRETFAQTAHVTPQRALADEGAQGVYAAHDGWVATHGLTHTRTLTLSADGRHLEGDDRLTATTPAARERFAAVMARTGLNGLGFAIRFHLHPDVDATLDMGGHAVSLLLKSGEIWVFRYQGNARLSLQPSVYLERGRQKPRATEQIVLESHTADLETRIGWTLAKAQDTPTAIRDLGADDGPFLS